MTTRYCLSLTDWIARTRCWNKWCTIESGQSPGRELRSHSRLQRNIFNAASGRISFESVRVSTVDSNGYSAGAEHVNPHSKGVWRDTQRPRTPKRNLQAECTRSNAFRLWPCKSKVRKQVSSNAISRMHPTSELYTMGSMIYRYPPPMFGNFVLLILQGYRRLFLQRTHVTHTIRDAD